MLLFSTLALASGLCSVISMVLNARLADHSGNLPGSRKSLISGLVTALIGFLAFGAYTDFSLDVLKGVPPHLFLGGFLYVIIMLLFNFAVPKIPVLYCTVITFVCQLFSGILLDFWLQGNLSLMKVAGGILIVVGLLYNVSIDGKGASSSTEDAFNHIAEQH